ncbi:putative nucleotidyltransferase, Ribonuclease H [Rosa chinensis]|uniref:RNA-directed DNA polymerase n=1 Tax=Rosa chinensis TaxID=74649 RepID=A0A2P6SDB9_ROSCH|nr:putative nucleotidyltransferase, Ribonuclease H [Rosa chinensis]
MGQHFSSPSVSTTSQLTHHPIQNQPNYPNQKPKPDGPFRKWSPSEQRERRAQGLCYSCDEQWSKTHVCKTPVMAILESPTPLEELPIEAIVEEDQPSDSEQFLPIHAITHTMMGQMMRFQGFINNQPISVFVDCGSATNFLNPAVARRLGLTIQNVSHLQFTSASGEQLSPSGQAIDTTVSIQGYQFTTSFLLLPVTGCDLLLGAQWLETLGFIGWHFSEKVMVFTENGQCHVLHGLRKQPSQMDQSAFMALLPAEHLDSVSSVTGTIPIQGSALIPELQPLLTSYEDLFSPPIGLPPKRAIDHRITLLPNAGPVNVRPYRYAHSQKTELEAQVQEMLSQGIIRPSRSPFSSPVLLVRKKEGTWRFCVDYRSLNNVTVKDRFPIPVVDELLDELHEAKYFSKLDLRSGYHQIRMHQEDIPKTAFRTHEGHYEFVVMPFGLSNGPSTFQALMNDVFKHVLRKFVLVFFDDILIYSSDLHSHLIHLEEVFQILQQHQLKVKMAKCSFCQSKVTYLGHVISGQGVSVDPDKVQCLNEWPKPQTVKGLRGFLGLAGYYRRFVQNFGLIAQPLNDMLKANNFFWSTAAEDAFQRLKLAVTTAPVLALPDFNQAFTVETDASGLGIGAVLTQQKHPIAYLSKTLSPKNQVLSVYDKEMFAILFAIDKWRPYLLGNQFTILTDHQTLKHLLTQRITTPSQHKWLAKLLGYDYKIEYRPGHLNTVPDVLSRKHELCAIQSISSPVFDNIAQIQQACSRDPDAQTIISALQQGLPTKKNFSMANNQLMYKNKIFVPQTSEWRSKILHEFHSSLQAGHSGYLRTLVRLSRSFYWPSMRKDIKSYIAACDQCQRQSYEAINPPGLLQPLPIPEGIWLDISMDFIDGLPNSQGKNAILVVIDRLSKYGHFIAVTHPYTAAQIAETFMKEVFRLHGMPKTIVSDRDPIFLSHFWKAFYKLQGTQLCHSSAYHPQSDGQTEVVNRSVEHYLRCFVADKPTSWNNLLHWAEWWYNTTYHSAIKMPPFQAVYGVPPPTVMRYVPGSTAVHSVDLALQDRDAFLQSLRENMAMAQNRMKQQSDKNRTEREFAVGDWVFLKLHPYRQQSLIKRPSHKLSPLFYGPFKILDRIGSVAYRLELPPSSKIHPVFHVSLLKKRVGDSAPLSQTLPQFDEKGMINWLPERVLDMSVVHKKKKAITQWLIQWSGLPKEDATWEEAHSIMARFPDFGNRGRLATQGAGTC